MSARLKPEHVLLRTEAVAEDTDFSWLDDAPKKRGMQPDPNSANQKMLRRKNEIATQNRREGVGNKQSRHRRSMTDDKWQKFLELTANGLKRADVLKVLMLTKETFEVWMITHTAAIKQLSEVDSVWMRRSWPLDEIELMLAKIASGKTIKVSGAELGYDEKRVGSFISLVRRDIRVKDMYDLARELQSEAWMDESIDIADNRSGDTFVDLKGIRKVDHAVIQRDRLRVDTRWRTMGAMNRKRFGDHKYIDHSGEIQVNHALLLSHARKRLEATKKPPTATIDNETQNVVNE